MGKGSKKKKKQAHQNPGGVAIDTEKKDTGSRRSSRTEITNVSCSSYKPNW